VDGADRFMLYVVVLFFLVVALGFAVAFALG
jgi:hypothetical protein